MLLEAFKHFTTPCAPHLKSMGYLRELIALDSRYTRCQSAWHPHLENTKSVITDAVDATSNRNKVVVLGAGILSDVPIKKLSDRFESVLLVDVCFLNKTRRHLKGFSNVVLATSDITDVAAQLHAGAPPKPSIPAEISLADADLVISANILSQLPIIPTEYYQQIKPSIDHDTVYTFGRKIVANHLAYLKTCPGHICLISEIERQYCNRDHTTKTEDPLWGYDLGLNGKEWFWDLAPKGEISKDFAIRNHIIGAHWKNDI